MTRFSPGKSPIRLPTKPTVLLIFGPTAVGKTKALLDHLPGRAEVISVDSVQVYRGLDIGSAKPTAEERALLPHHLVDIRDPREGFDVGNFVQEAEACIRSIHARSLVPVLSGGTAFYFFNFLFGLPEVPPVDPGIREEVERLFREDGAEGLSRELQRVDPVSHGRLAAADHYRRKRSLEIFYQTGRPQSSFPRNQEIRRDYHFRILELTRPREELYQRILHRCREMVRDGLVDEVRNLLAQGIPRDSQALSSIGYRQTVAYLEANGVGNQESLVEEMALASRQYGKRQQTFFSKIPDRLILNPERDTRQLSQTLEDWLEQAEQGPSPIHRVAP